MSKAPKYDPTLIGYVRVSSEEQNLDLQIEAMKRAGVDPQMIFKDKVSGIAARKPGREQAIRQCRPGDTLVVWKLDRVSRSLLDLLKLMEALDAEKIGFRSLTETIDTSTPIGRMFVGVLGSIAQFERDIIQMRSQAGVDRAIERGVKFGQPTIFTPETKEKIKVWVRENRTIPWIAGQLKCHPGTIRRVYTFPVLEAIRAGKNPKIVTTSKDRKHVAMKTKR
jgi:DNA invertase Pin-like site-specific DNA recombinase